MIPIEECKDKHLYIIGARNSDLGVYLESDKGFVINRHKCGMNFLFVEYHWDTGEPYGTAKCIEDLGPAKDLPWEGWTKENECEMLKYLSDKYDEHDVVFRRSLRYCVDHGNMSKTAEEIVDYWAMEQPEEMKNRLREAVQKELDVEAPLPQG